MLGTLNRPKKMVFDDNLASKRHKCPNFQGFLFRCPFSLAVVAPKLLACKADLLPAWCQVELNTSRAVRALSIPGKAPAR